MPVPPAPSLFCQRQQDDNGEVQWTLSVNRKHNPSSCRHGGRTLRMLSWCSSWARTMSLFTLSSSLQACWGQVSHCMQCVPALTCQHSLACSGGSEGFMWGMHMHCTSPSTPCQPAWKPEHKPLIHCMQCLPVRCHNVACTYASAWLRTCHHRAFLRPFSMAVQAAVVLACLGTATIIISGLLLA